MLSGGSSYVKFVNNVKSPKEDLKKEREKLETPSSMQNKTRATTASGSLKKRYGTSNSNSRKRGENSEKKSVVINPYGSMAFQGNKSDYFRGAMQRGQSARSAAY